MNQIVMFRFNGSLKILFFVYKTYEKWFRKTIVTILKRSKTHENIFSGFLIHVEKIPIVAYLNLLKNLQLTKLKKKKISCASTKILT